MKHPYSVDCECARCAKERARRGAQSLSDSGKPWSVRPVPRPRRKSSKRPAVGSQEWAETRGDDLGESPDY